MVFLSAFLFCIASDLETLKISLPYRIKKMYLSKSIAILLAIITSIGIFLSMYLGALIAHLFDPKLANVFGAILLSLIGVYFIVEYIRVEKEHAGYDTSYYYQTTSKYKLLLENQDILAPNKSNHIDIKAWLTLFIALTLNNLCTGFAASITGINIGLSVSLNFIITLSSIYLGSFNSNIVTLKWLNKYSNLISGVILIILGIYESFI